MFGLDNNLNYIFMDNCYCTGCSKTNAGIFKLFTSCKLFKTTKQFKYLHLDDINKIMQRCLSLSMLNKNKNYDAFAGANLTTIMIVTPECNTKHMV